MGVVILGIMIPFIGTVLGSSCVFFMKDGLGERVNNALSGFAAGVMVAASVWSLLIPAMEMSLENEMGRLAFVPAVAGFLLGIAFLLLLDHVIPHLHVNLEEAEGPKVSLAKSTMLILAVTLHNIPEGMAVGVVFAGMLAESQTITLMGAFALAIGIAIQNFPEGAIISMPVCAAGCGRGKAFIYGALSGAVEPIGAVITILLSRYLIPVMPYLLSFAAGAMVYVVVEELIPESAQGKHSNIGTIGFAVGFALMMALDVALG
ncbi:MAG: ZIP family metal transporter [Lachnospiraceae bacterium]